MKKFLIIALALMAFFSIGCVATTERVNQHMTYFKDQRTGTCFSYVAMNYAGDWSISISYVPCTPEIERAIQQDKPQK